MKNISIFILFIVALGIQCTHKNIKTSKPLLAPKKVVKDVYYSQKIKDPYRYMENLKDSVFISWMKSQNNYSKSILEAIPFRNRLKGTIENLAKSKDFSVFGLQIVNSDSYYYIKKSNTKNSSILYTRKGFNSDEHLLFDPSNPIYKLEKGLIINYIKPNWDETKILISLSKNDEEISILRILNIKNNELLLDKITNTWPAELGGVNWMSDNLSFTYTHIPIIDSNSEDYLLNTKTVLYRIGQPNAILNDVFSKENNLELNIKEEDFPILDHMNFEDDFIIGIIAGASHYSDTYICSKQSFENHKTKWKLLFSKEERIAQFFIKSNTLYFRTAKNASNYSICKTSLNNPNFNNPKIIVEEDSLAVISDFALTKQGVIFVKLKNGVEAKLFSSIKNKIASIPIPKSAGKINVSAINTNENKLEIGLEGWINNYERYIYDCNSKKFKVENFNPVVQYDFLKEIVIKEIEITSHDGTQVPLSIIYKKGLKTNGDNRVLINGYGSYGWSNSPYLYSYLLHWLNNGGVYAIAHVRGGGEKGDAWHKGGYKTTKPNTWKDFIACTEYLINENYTTQKKIVAWSASAGAICIGRAITERPDLYAAAIIRVGDFNTIRSEFAPNGKNNIKEFGTVKDSIEFKALLEMDSYHHVKDGVKYPAVLLTAGMKDTRVPAWQPAKFAARLQAATTSGKPILLKVDFEGGHGFEASKEKKNRETADIISFALWQTGHPDFQPK